MSVSSQSVLLALFRGGRGLRPLSAAAILTGTIAAQSVTQAFPPGTELSALWASGSARGEEPRTLIFCGCVRQRRAHAGSRMAGSLKQQSPIA